MSTAEHDSTAAALHEAFGDWTPRCVVFDCDGLLLDTESVWQRTQATVIAETRVELTEDDRAVLHGSTVEQAADVISARAGSDREPVLHRLYDVFDELLSDGIRLMPGAADVVAEAAARVPIACASNSWLEALDRKLTGGGIRQHFTSLQASDTVEKAKPAPDMYAAAARALGVDPADALGLEDSETGAQAARAAGLRLIAVPTAGPAPRADLTLESLADPALLEWIRSW